MNTASAKNYDRVMVSAIRHTDDDIDCKGDAEKLRRVINDMFHIGTSVFNIPTHDTAHSQLRDHIQDIISVRPGQKELHIIHYGGHGRSNESSSRPWLWGSGEKKSKKETKVNWAEIIQEQLQQCRKDVVLILDCCNAAGAFRSEPRGRLVIFAACAREEVTGSLESAYTMSLIRVLSQLQSATSIKKLFDDVGEDRSIRRKTEPVLYEYPTGAASTMYIASWPQSAYSSTEHTPSQVSHTYQPSMHALERPRPLVPATAGSYYLGHSEQIAVRSPTTFRYPPEVLLNYLVPAESRSTLTLEAWSSSDRGDRERLTVGFPHAIKTEELRTNRIYAKVQTLARIVEPQRANDELKLMFQGKLLTKTATCLAEGISNGDTITVLGGYSLLHTLNRCSMRSQKRPNEESEDPVQAQSNKRRRI